MEKDSQLAQNKISPVENPTPKEEIKQPINISSAEAKRYAARQKSNPPHKSWKLFGYTPWLVFVLCFSIFVLAYGFGKITNDTDSQPKRSRYPEKFDVKAACEHLVKLHLKSPATAQFSPWPDTVIIGTNTGPWDVTGYVDSQNSFGALLRSNYSCRIQYDGSKIELLGISVN